MKLSEFETIRNKPVSFKIKEVFPKCIFLGFKTGSDLSSSFIRFQEHYESPKFKNKKFSMKEFYRWYKKERGSFSYIDDWSGFNIPSTSLNSFKRSKFTKITQREKAILNILPKGKFYIIASEELDRVTQKHEIAHALFFLNTKYKKNVMKILKTIKNPSPAFEMLKEKGYHKSVLWDELHAYILSDLYMIKNSGTVVTPKVKKELNDLFNTTLKKVKK